MAEQHAAVRATDAEFAAAWRAHRPYLVNLAFGMLRDIGAAEDAVQEAFARFADIDYPSVQDERAWLIVVTGRICLDQLNSARRRRERAFDTGTIEFAGEPAATAPAALDPADRVTLDDEVRSALLIVLDRLTPAERVVFVLHDVFRTPFDEIAETIGRPVATTRQLARRARLKIGSRTSDAAPPDTVQQRQVIDRFIEATAGGDLSALVSLLAPDVWGSVDLGPADRRTGTTNHGARKVGRNVMHWFGRTPTMVVDPASDACEILAYLDRQLYAVIQLDLGDGFVRSLHVIADQAQLAVWPERSSWS
jgi:RNA polymerase sigma-70 factor (ECF subfamily)